MNKADFLREMTKSLKENGVGGTGDIIAEYEEHFSFKLADGFSEEEIAAKLGTPAELAQQYSPDREAPATGRKAITVTGLVFSDIFVGIFYIVVFAFAIALAVTAVSFFATGIYLIFGMDFIRFMPNIPYGAALLFALGLLALSLLTACGTVYYTSYVLALVRTYARFHKNCMATAAGEPALPPLPVRTRLGAKTRRVIRIAAMSSLITGVFFLAAAYAVSALTAGAIEFWHVWGWFEG